jgi:hypothetical protein
MPLPGPPNLACLRSNYSRAIWRPIRRARRKRDSSMRLFRYRIIRQVKHLDPNLFLLNCRALRPRPNRLLDMKTDAAAC